MPLSVLVSSQSLLPPAFSAPAARAICRYSVYSGHTELRDRPSPQIAVDNALFPH